MKAEVGAAIDKASERLLKLQHEDGYWWGELESNSSMEAEYLLMTHFLGAGDSERWRKIVNRLRSKQQPDGGWAIWHGGPGDLSITVEVYFAMKLAGVPADDPAMSRARALVLAKGGVAETRVFTKLWLALFGQWDWKGTPSLPPEILLLPAWSPFNVYEFASWARATIVACTVLLTLRPVCKVSPAAHIDELYAGGRKSGPYTFRKEAPVVSWAGVFGAADAAAKLFEGAPVKPLRRKALMAVEDWLLQHQEADGSWAGIQPPWVYSLMALKTLGYEIAHPVMRKGLAGFEVFGREEPDGWHMDACISPVWDTCLALLALREAGLPQEHPALIKSMAWLQDKQILDKPGDWKIKNPRALPGGWPFEFHNDNYPDIDDTAMVLIALKTMPCDSPRVREAMDRGLGWLVSMQSRNGGWGSFDKDNTRRFVGAIPFCDFGEVLDAPTADVTAHVVQLLGMAGYPADGPPMREGLRYLLAQQEPDGSWWGRWGVNHVYGVGAVLPALRAGGLDMASEPFKRAADWLRAHQNPDGGWGEACESYVDPSQRGKGPSTASQTAWALMGLIAAAEAGSEAAERGVQYLLEAQGPTGSWDEPFFTGTGFPGAFMLNYHLYRLYWPLAALGRYRQAMLGQSGAMTMSSGAKGRT